MLANGISPVSTSKKVIAKLYTSAAFVYFSVFCSSSNASGALHRVAPICFEVNLELSKFNFENPKSVTFTCTDGEMPNSLLSTKFIRILLALRSRCITPLSCKYLMASAICSIISTAKSSGSGGWVRPWIFSSKYLRRSMVMSSVTMICWLPLTAYPMNWTTFGCRNLACKFASFSTALITLLLEAVKTLAAAFTPRNWHLNTDPNDPFPRKSPSFTSSYSINCRWLWSELAALTLLSTYSASFVTSPLGYDVLL